MKSDYSMKVLLLTGIAVLPSIVLAQDVVEPIDYDDISQFVWYEHQGSDSTIRDIVESRCANQEQWASLADNAAIANGKLVENSLVGSGDTILIPSCVNKLDEQIAEVQIQIREAEYRNAFENMIAFTDAGEDAGGGISGPARSTGGQEADKLQDALDKLEALKEKLNQLELLKQSELDRAGAVMDAAQVTFVEHVSTDDTCSEIDWDEKHVEIMNVLRYEIAAMLDKDFSPQTATIGLVDSGVISIGESLKEEHFRKNNGETRDGTRADYDDDDNRYIDDIFGTDFIPTVEGSGDRARDGSGNVHPHSGIGMESYIYSHGTQVSSVLLGGQESIDSNFVAEIRPIELVVANFIDPESSNNVQKTEKLPKALEYLSNRSSNVINLSLSSRKKVIPVLSSIQSNKDVLFVVAAGNSKDKTLGLRNLDEFNRYPASYGGKNEAVSNVLSVGSHTAQYMPADHSFWGQRVDIHAPGCNIKALSNADNFSKVTGTSFAAAWVSYAAGLLYYLHGEFDSLSPQIVKRRILASADYFVGLNGFSWTSAALNIPKALSLNRDVVVVGKEKPIFGKIENPDILYAFCKEDEIRNKLSNTILRVQMNIEEDGLRKVEFWDLEPDNSKIRKIRCNLANFAGEIKFVGGEKSMDVGGITSVVLSSY